MLHGGRREKAFNEWWHKTAQHEKDWYTDKPTGDLVYENSQMGDIFEVYDHRVIFCEADSIDDLMGYDLRTGEAKKLTKTETEEWKYRWDATDEGAFKS